MSFKLHQRSDKDWAAGSGIASDKNIAFNVPIDWLAAIDLVDEMVFEGSAGFLEIFDVGKLFNIGLEFSLHHQAVKTDELDTIVHSRVMGGSDLDTYLGISMLIVPILYRQHSPYITWRGMKRRYRI